MTGKKRMQPVPKGYDMAAGHLAVAHGDPAFASIDWASGLCEQGQSIESFVEREHMIYGIEMNDTDLELILVRGDLRLHTDLTSSSSLATVGLILQADAGAEITTGRSRLPIRAGDVYRLDPNRLHGAFNSGLLAFVARDYRHWQEPTPADFRIRACEQLKRHFTRKGYAFT